VSISSNFLYILGQKIWGPAPFLKNGGGAKHAKFGLILHHFRFWPRISP